jgi:hypothetical protein
VKVFTTDIRKRAIGIVCGKVIGGQAKVVLWLELNYRVQVFLIFLIHTCRQVMAKKITALLKRLRQENLPKFINISTYPEFPTILVGDLNTRPGDVAHENIVEIACLERIMSIVSRIDHIYAKKGPDYQFEVLETIEIQEGIASSGKPIRLSDHNGYMTRVKIMPTKIQTNKDSFFMIKNIFKTPMILLLCSSLLQC